MKADFDASLEVGKIGESLIAKWLLRKGTIILPVYEVAKDNYKGPTLYMSESVFISPDFLAYNPDKDVIYWGEVKYKSAFSWYRKMQIWTTGIDKAHYDDYIEISKKIKWPLYLFFLHRGLAAKDSPVSEGGLYGGEIRQLKDKINHISDKWGKGGMVYWDKKDLTFYASLSEIEGD